MSPRKLRKLLLVIGLPILVALALLTYALLTYYCSERRVPTDVARQAKPGLTVAQVEELFGSPGRPVLFADDPSQPGSVLIVLDSPNRAWVKAERARDPGATWRVWRGAETDGNEVYWVVYFREGVVVEVFGVGGPGLFKRLRYQMDRLRSQVGL
jgi:hypothetical protein